MYPRSPVSMWSTHVMQGTSSICYSSSALSSLTTGVHGTHTCCNLLLLLSLYVTHHVISFAFSDFQGIYIGGVDNMSTRVAWRVCSRIDSTHYSLPKIGRLTGHTCCNLLLLLSLWIDCIVDRMLFTSDNAGVSVQL